MNDQQNINPLTASGKELQELVDEIFRGFMQTFPPAKARSVENLAMTTSEVFDIIDSHCPDSVTPGKLAVMLRSNGYISAWDSSSHQFAWLISNPHH